MSKIFEQVKVVSDLQESKKPADHMMLVQRALKLTEEAGEISAEVLKLTGYKGSEDSQQDIINYLKEEVVDALICVLDIANHVKMTESEIEDIMTTKLNKWRTKHLKEDTSKLPLDSKKVREAIILGGGTFEPIRNHLALSAPAFGTTAKRLHELIPGSNLVLTKMVNPDSNLKSNEDVERYIDLLLKDMNVGTIILNVAFCDYRPEAIVTRKATLFGEQPILNYDFGFHSERLKTSEGNIELILSPADKVITKIRKERPDIFLVGFKTTTNKTSEEQFSIALKMMKSVKCNLVLANDTVTRNNMIITAEETIYGETKEREDVLKELAEMISMRSNLTYNESRYIGGYSFDMSLTPPNFRSVIKFLIDNGGFIENNGNGFTPGHFCWMDSENSFLSSQRKANHNEVFTYGLSKVEVKDGIFTVMGAKKASVGARSQWMILQENFGADCIIHTHNPLKEGSLIPITPQKPFQCGSLECGINTVSHMKSFGSIKAVYLEKHGANILFNSSNDPQEVIDFIKANIELGVKVK